MAAPRRDTRGIVDAAGLFQRVRFRRREPASALRPYLEHYWLIDWDLDEPYVSHVVPHPSVNVVFQHLDVAGRRFAEVAGIRHELFAQKLSGRGRVCGAQFRPGGFRPFSPARPVSYWTGRRVPLAEAMPTTDDDIAAVLGPDAEDDRVAAFDTYLLAVLATRAEAAESAGADAVDWAALAAELGYSDQAHLVRDFTATVGVPPTAYLRRA